MANKKSSGKKKSGASSQQKPAVKTVDKAETASEIKVKEETAPVPAKPKGTEGKKQAKKPGKVAKYFRDLKSEFKKVVWPSKNTVVNNTGVVLVVMIGSALVMWGLDSGFAALLKGLLSLAGA
ncbi:MAG: preprotein translocase subunit SecE [Ruminococcus sp.]|nr:preprotein translocase subunit SecE [Ruminococcus sp.]